MYRLTYDSLKIYVFILLLFFIAVANSAPSLNHEFNQLANEFFDTYFFPFNPSLATDLGIHRYDAQLEDYSKSNMQKRINLLKQFADRVRLINPNRLDEQTQGDRELILNHIHSELLTLTTLKPWEKDPDDYSSGIARSAFVLMKHQFAPLNERLQLLIARERQMPSALQAARQNLKNPPRIYVEIANETLPELIHFFQHDLPAAFITVTDPVLQQQFSVSNAKVIQELRDYQTWLQNDLLPRAHGDFRIGAEALSKKLYYDEMVDIPLDRLLAIGYDNLHKNQLAYQQLINELGTNLPNQHPPAKQLLETFSHSFDGLIKFIHNKKIISIPSSVKPLVEETPPFLRSITFASMDTPGPFESKAEEAYMNVTLPKSTWSKEKTETFMRGFTDPVIQIISIHEAYPGHYVQFLWLHQIKDRVRKILGARTNLEGWAHYCEQMILDEGYGQSDTHKAKWLRLGQLKEALLRNARFIVAIKMHTGTMTFDQAVDFFVQEGHQSRVAALMETKRGTVNPTYLYYTLGKLQILKLRSDLETKLGTAFNLQKFHDAFMRQGYPPIKIVRRALLHDRSATL